jgi:hypothetical protein
LTIAARLLRLPQAADWDMIAKIVYVKVSFDDEYDLLRGSSAYGELVQLHFHRKWH